MKKLELNQMGNVEGGSFWGAVACIGAGAAVSVFLSPIAGFALGFMCEAALNPAEAQ